MSSCEFSKISKNTFPYRTPPVAVSDSSTVTFIELFALKIKLIIICFHILVALNFEEDYCKIIEFGSLTVTAVKVMFRFSLTNSPTKSFK